MRENRVKRAMREGAVMVGSWVSMEGTLGAEIMANAGFDWLVIDMEHGPISMTEAQSSIAAIRTTATVPLIRPAWNESALIQTALDIGAYGIIVPMVNTRAEAEQVVRDTRYPPLGERSRGGVRSRLAFNTDATTYGLRANDEILLLLQIETDEAMANAGAMLALDGVDGIFLGPNDMASSLGCWPPVWVNQPPELAEAIARIATVAREYGKVAGILTPNATAANQCIALGYQFVGLTSDAAFLETAARQELAAVSTSAKA